MTKAITRLNPPTLPDAGAIGYSQISIVEPGRTAYISGQVAWRPGGEPVPADLVEQTKIVGANAKAALEAVGATTEDIIIARCFLTDMNPQSMEQVMPPLIAIFGGAFPCLTGVGVAALAAPDLRIELELTVRLPN